MIILSAPVLKNKQPSPCRQCEAFAERKGQGIQADIESRTGLKDVWNEIPAEIKSEIIEKWTLMVGAVVGAALKTVASKQPANLSDGQQTKSDSHDLAQ